jgi:hypothetical protein
LRRILTGALADPATIAAALAGQRDDGGWAPLDRRGPARSGLEATGRRLMLAEKAGAARLVAGGRPGTGDANDPGAEYAPLVAQLSRAARFLVERQHADGTWEEDGAGAGAPPETESTPPAAARGDIASCLYQTAHCGLWVAVYGRSDGTAAAMGAADAIEQEMGATDRLPSCPQTHWLAAGLLFHAGRTVAAERVLDHVRVVLVPDLDARDLASTATVLAVAGLPARHPTVRAAVGALSRRQQLDGRWRGGTRHGGRRSEDGADGGDASDESDVETTLDALRVLRWFGRSRATDDLAPRRRDYTSP